MRAELLKLAAFEGDDTLPPLLRRPFLLFWAGGGPVDLVVFKIEFGAVVDAAALWSWGLSTGTMGGGMVLAETVVGTSAISVCSMSELEISQITGVPGALVDLRAGGGDRNSGSLVKVLLHTSCSYVNISSPI